MARSETPGSDAMSNLPVYSVSEISGAVKRTLETEFSLVRVRGEISGKKLAASGHLYFSLKDEEAVLDSVAWRGTLPRLPFALEDGLEVICTGRITSYPGRSKYQIVVEAIELAGEGALLKLLAERRRKLEAEGLFAPERKKEIPYLPEVIGVVTSLSGAVIRDILHRLADRFPRHVLIWPVIVQGEGAAEQVAAAIRGFNALDPKGAVPRPDVLIVARGGGSLEDLWAFNEEIVVRAAAESEIPLISAIGHETDVTLIDFAADLRAPTPTAAAEMAVPVRAELLAGNLDLARRMVAGMARLLSERRTRLEGLRRGLPDPASLLSTALQRLDDRVERLANAVLNLFARLSDREAKLSARLRHPRELIGQKSAALSLSDHRLVSAVSRIVGNCRHRYKNFATRLPHPQILIEQKSAFQYLIGHRFATAVTRLVSEAGHRFNNTAALLDSFSYERVLDRGFALVMDAGGAPVTSALALSPGDDAIIRFGDGEIGARVTTGAKLSAGYRAGGASGDIPGKKAAEKPAAKKAKKDGRQGELL